MQAVILHQGDLYSYWNESHISDTIMLAGISFSIIFDQNLVQCIMSLRI